MIQFIDDNKHLYGVELICRVLPIAPSTYYRAQDLSDNLNRPDYVGAVQSFIFI
jgi:hypothetical protein